MALSEKKFLVFVLILAFLVRLPSLGYGLPHLFFVDEFIQTTTALKMLGSHNPFLSFSYLPPLMAYLIAPWMALIALAGKIIGVWPTLSAFQEFALLQGGYLVMVSRLISVIFGLAGVYFVYRLGRSVFGYRVAVVASLILAFDFLHVLESQAGRFWAGLTLAFILALYALAKLRESGRTKWLWLSVAAIASGYGLGLGTLFLIPWLILYIWLARKAHPGSLSIRTISGAAITLVLLLAFFSAANTYSFSRQFGRMFNTILNPTGYQINVPAASDQEVTANYATGAEIIVFDALLSDAPVLLLLFLAGATWFFWSRRRRFIFSDQALIFVYFPVLYLAMLPLVFSSVNVRYVLPALPFMFILASAFIFELLSKMKAALARAALPVILALVIGPGFLALSFHDVKLTRTDTRVQAARWLEKEAGNGNVLLTDIEDFDLWLVPSQEGIKIKRANSPERIRSRDEYLEAKSADYPAPAFAVIDSEYMDNWQEIIKDKKVGYIIHGFQDKTELNPFKSANARMVKSFYPAPDTSLALRKYIEEGVASWRWEPAVERYGPYIEIYAVNR